VAEATPAPVTSEPEAPGISPCYGIWTTHEISPGKPLPVGFACARALAPPFCARSAMWSPLALGFEASASYPMQLALGLGNCAPSA
jgi:hypothetical protein